jgi:hypothetical protein
VGVVKTSSTCSPAPSIGTPPDKHQREAPAASPRNARDSPICSPAPRGALVPLSVRDARRLGESG